MNNTRIGGPVDVLEVLDENIRRAEEAGNIERSDRLQAARAAVAELIEAAINVHAAVRAGKEPDLIALADCIDAVGGKAARKAALANVGSAS